MNVAGIVILVVLAAVVFFIVRAVRKFWGDRGPRHLPECELWTVTCQAGTKDAPERISRFLDTYHRSVVKEPLLIWLLFEYAPDPDPDRGVCEVETLVFGLPKSKSHVGVSLLQQHFENGKVKQLTEEDHFLYTHMIQEFERLAAEKEAESSEHSEPDLDTTPSASSKNIYSRALPEIDGSAYVLRRGERSSFLPFRTVIKDSRPLSDIFASYASLKRGQLGVIELVLRALPKNERRALWQNDRAFFRGDLEEGSDNSSGPSKSLKAVGGFFKCLELVGRSMHGQSPIGAGTIRANDKVRPEKKAKSQAESENEEIKEREAKSDKKLFETTFYTGVIIPGNSSPDEAALINEELTEHVLGLLEPETSQIDDGLEADGCPTRDMIGAHPHSAQKSHILMSAEEVSAIAHPVDDLTNTHGIKTESMRLPQWPKPDYLPTTWKKGRFLLGYKGEVEGVDPVYMTFKDLLGGLAVSGASRNGKTVWVENLIEEAFRSHIPTIVFDPHMTLIRGAAWLTAYQYPELLKDKKVCWIDFTERRFPPRYNPCAAYDDVTEEVAVPEVMSILAEMAPMEKLDRGKAYIYEAVANFVHINRLMVQEQAEQAEEQAIAGGREPEDFAVLCRRAMRDGSVKLFSMLSLPRYFTDEDFCLKCMEQADAIDKDQLLMNAFWEKDQKARDEIIGPLLWRFKEISKSHFFRQIIGSPQNTVDFTELIADHSVVLIGANILGSRSEIGKAVIGPLVKKCLMEDQLLYEANDEQPTDSLLIVDEAPVVANASAREMSAAADQLAKIGLRLVLIYQRLEQMYKKPGGDILCDAIKGFANRIAFKGSPADADCVLAGLDSKKFSKDELYTLYRYFFMARLTTAPKGDAPRIENPFILRSPFPGRPEPTKCPEDPEGAREWGKCKLVVDEMIARGRKRFCWSAAEAEDAIRESYDTALDDLAQLKIDRSKREGVVEDDTDPTPTDPSRVFFSDEDLYEEPERVDFVEGETVDDAWDSPIGQSPSTDGKYETDEDLDLDEEDLGDDGFADNMWHEITKLDGSDEKPARRAPRAPAGLLEETPPVDPRPRRTPPKHKRSLPAVEPTDEPEVQQEDASAVDEAVEDSEWKPL